MVRFRAMLREHGLTEQQWRVLRAVQAIGRPEVSELAQATFLLPPSLSRILPDLQGRNLLTIDPHMADQRRKVVRITAAGQALMEEIAPRSEAIYSEIHRRVGADEMSELEALLLRIEAKLGTETAPNEDGRR